MRRSRYLPGELDARIMTARLVGCKQAAQEGWTNKLWSAEHDQVAGPHNLTSSRVRTLKMKHRSLEVIDEAHLEIDDAEKKTRAW